MATKRISLKAFLSSAKAALNAQQQKPLTYVVGNESADLDSICCAIIYAYIKSSTPPYTLYVPLSNIPRSDLSLRPELKPVLSKANLQPSDLITLSDIRDGATKTDQFFLVDHNALTGHLSKVNTSQVVGCIDHHDEEHFVPAAATIRSIEQCGSCMSLIIAECKQAWEELSRNGDDIGVAHVSLAPILIDTNCLKNESKVKDVDTASVAFLEDLIHEHGYERETYFDEISKAKQDIDSLNLDEILRKDYKSWEENELKLGVSSAVKNIKYMSDKASHGDGLPKTMKAFAAERELDILAIMTTSTFEGKFRRELLVSAFSSKGAQAVQKFEKDDGEELGLKGWQQDVLDSDGDIYRRCYIQESIQFSRKKVGPMLRKAMRGE